MNLTNEDIWRESCLVWAYDNKIKNEKGVPLEFKQHAFLKDIFDDFTPVQTFRKASQVGFSTMMILKTLYAARYRNYNIIYTLPTAGDVGQFVGSKVNPIIQNNPVLAYWTKDKDTIEQKKVGQSFIYYRGTMSSKSEKEKSEGGTAIILTSDWNVHDECDRSDQVTLEQYESRLDNSQFKGRCYFSNPTNPKTLSQDLYELSDQKHWFVKCPRCNEWQYLDYWRNIRDGAFVCCKCAGEISSEVRRAGRWIKKYRNREISGYWINHLVCPWISAEAIQKQFETKSKAYFYNFVLGLPYVGSEIVVNRDLILKNLDDHNNLHERNVMGVDVGLTKHFVLMNQQGVFRTGALESWDEIEMLLRQYDVECCVIDALPDLTEPRKLRDRFPGKVWLSYFKKDVRSGDFIKWDSDTHTVYSDRTKAIQWVIDDMVERKLRFQMRLDDLENYIRHWGNIYKVTEKDSLGIERDVWETSGSEDHYVFAQIYACLALDRIAGDDTARLLKWGEPSEPFDGLAPSVV
jgi:hypothetical protein